MNQNLKSHEFEILLLSVVSISVFPFRVMEQ